jgi:hypothetical protein
MRTMRGGASGFAIGAVGKAWGLAFETTRFGGRETGLDEHPQTEQMAPATNAQSARRRGFRGESKDDSR